MNYEIIAENYGVLLLWVPSYAPFSSDGKYNPDLVVDSNHPNGTIFIKDSLNDNATIKVFLHELGHRIDGTPLTKLSAPQQHLSNEALANRYMIHEKAREWFRGFEGNYPSNIDVKIFIRWAKIPASLYPIAEDELRDLAKSKYRSFI